MRAPQAQAKRSEKQFDATVGPAIQHLSDGGGPIGGGRFDRRSAGGDAPVRRVFASTSLGVGSPAISIAGTPVCPEQHGGESRRHRALPVGMPLCDQVPVEDGHRIEPGTQSVEHPGACLEIDRLPVVGIDEVQVPQIGALVEIGHAGAPDLHHELR